MGNAAAAEESVSAMSARNVVDGLALARWWQNPPYPNIAHDDKSPLWAG
jgi:hypothetical protein